MEKGLTLFDLTDTLRTDYIKQQKGKEFSETPFLLSLPVKSRETPMAVVILPDSLARSLLQ